MELCVNTIYNLLEVKVDYYVLFDISTFRKAVSSAYDGSELKRIDALLNHTSTLWNCYYLNFNQKSYNHQLL
jgi:anionic cell wall polymer biosynthesis LytR-Cps2A-Psr (LCP) family protein